MANDSASGAEDPQQVGCGADTMPCTDGATMRVLWAVLGLGVGCSGDGDPTDLITTGPECAVEERDCAGVCFGDAVEDNCGRCDDDPSNDCAPFVVTNASWTCKDGVTCQDVWEVDLPGATDVTVKVTDVSGDSVVRLAAFAPDSRPGGVNVLVGRNKDLACWGVDEPAEASFRAPERGTWRIVVGRDDAGSDGMFGAYTLEVVSTEGLTMGDAPFQDDAPSQAVGARCGNEYQFESGWRCRKGESCQDSYSVELEAGTLLDLEITDLPKSSTAGLGLYGPGNATGDTNLLTNTRNERVCTAAGESLVAPPLLVEQSGRYTVTATRRADLSTGETGSYAIAIGADAFFERPQPDDQDLRTAAPGVQCDWSFDTSAGWACPIDETCQDVFEIELLAGTSVSAVVRNVTGNSVVSAGLFPPGEGRGGTNAYTDDTTDYACFGPSKEAPLPIYDVASDGMHELTIGRDGAASTGTTGTYDLRIEVRDGYGGSATGTGDDLATKASGVECP